jgi:hypothetical protein
LGRSPVRAQQAVELVSEGAREAVFARLEQRGLLVRHRTRRLGVFPATRWEVPGEVVRYRLRTALERVLVGGEPPDVRLACLVSLLHAVRAEHRVVDGPARSVRARAAEIAADELIGGAVRGAVTAVRTAVLLHRPLSGADAQSRPRSIP